VHLDLTNRESVQSIQKIYQCSTETTNMPSSKRRPKPLTEGRRDRIWPIGVELASAKPYR